MNFEQSTQPPSPKDEVPLFQADRLVRVKWSVIAQALGFYTAANGGALNLGKPLRWGASGNAASTDPVLNKYVGTAAGTVVLPTTGNMDGDTRAYHNGSAQQVGWTLSGPFSGGLGSSIVVGQGNVLWIFWDATDSTWGVL